MFLQKAQKRARDANATAMCLKRLNALHGRHDTQEALLQQASETVADLLGVESCIITLLSEDKTTMLVRACCSRNGANGRITANGHAVHISGWSQTNGQVLYPHLESASGEIDDDEMHVAPLCVKGQIIGYMYALTGKTPLRQARRFDAELFAVLSEQIGFAIETQQMRYLLASRYAAAAAKRDHQSHGAEQELIEFDVLRAVQEPENVAKVIARSFYKDLRRAGFETKQILVVASEIIGSLNEALCKTKAKTEEAPTAN